MKPEIIQTVDVVLLTIKNNKLHVALIKRENEPFKDQYALPGGYVHKQEDNDCLDSALRVLKDKADIIPPYLEQLHTFSGKHRDPRGWSISVAYFALVSLDAIEGNVTLVDIDAIKGLPFDHEDIIKAAISRVRNKAQYSSLPCHLAGPTFTLPELQKIYETCLNEPLHKVSFRRKMDEMDILEVVSNELAFIVSSKKMGDNWTAAAHRPAAIYKLKDSYLDNLRILERGL